MSGKEDKHRNRSETLEKEFTQNVKVRRAEQFPFSPLKPFSEVIPV